MNANKVIPENFVAGVNFEKITPIKLWTDQSQSSSFEVL